MSLRYCRMCTTQYAQGLGACPHCGKDDKDNLNVEEVNPPKDEETFDKEQMKADIQEVKEGSPSAGTSSSTSQKQTDASGSSSSVSQSKPAPTTAPPSSTEKASDAAPTTGGSTQGTTTQQSTQGSDQSKKS
jgi:hypothetical protein